jgi:RND family efflux transporter MFP subunit
MVIVAGAVIGLRSVNGSRAPVAVASPPPVPAAVVLVRRRDLSKTLSVVAELRPWNVVNIYAKQSGYLKQISVDYGSRVSAGETIATLDLPEQQAAYQQAEASYKLARVDYDRILAVVHTQPGLIAAADVDKAEAAFEEAKDARDQDAALLDYANISAPFSGVVSKRYADPGALIQAGTSTGTEPVVQLSDDYVLRLVVEVPEANVEKIAVGTPVDVTIQSTGQVIHGAVARFSYDVHEDTRTMHTEVDIPNAALGLKPGMYASATFVLQHRDRVLAVPPQAVSQSGTQSNVWIVGSDDRIEQRTVTTGLATADWVEITGGLRLGDRVFFGNRSTLAVGDRVRPKVAASING